MGSKAAVKNDPLINNKNNKLKKKQHPTRLNDVAGGDRGNSSTFVATSHVRIKLQPQFNNHSGVRQTDEQQHKIQQKATIIYSSMCWSKCKAFWVHR